MIRDILGGCLDEDFWELNALVSKKKKSTAKDDSPVSKKKKTKAEVEESEGEDEDDSPVEKKKKMKKSKAKVFVEESEDEDDSPVEKKDKKKSKAKVLVEESEDEDDSPVEKKEKKKEKRGKRKIRSDTSGDEDSEEECDMDIPLKNIPKLKKKKETKEGDIGEVLKLLQRMVGTIAKFDTRLTSLEGKGNASKVVVDEQSKTGVSGDASVEDDLSKRVVFKEKEPTAAKMKEGAECVKIYDLTKDAIADAGKKKEGSDSDFVTPSRPRKSMHYAYSSSSDDEDDVRAKEINTALDKVLGHSGTIQIMAGIEASPVVYNPFELVDQHKEARLVEFVKKDL
ncbi:hypothetical protein AALP_AA7G106100 [Arabis alpina]|uniref:Uncharacterized protein n=1 Tax=Arabis alpina TaxID=50452 RepID=A0A087GH74_ARAAL|nr:hypothetical protein AALP_AA7G106100 [Arabis alpina]